MVVLLFISISCFAFPKLNGQTHEALKLKTDCLRGSLVMLWARTQRERSHGCSVCFRSATLNLLERIFFNKFSGVNELQRKESTSQIMPV